MEAPRRHTTARRTSPLRFSLLVAMLGYSGCGETAPPSDAPGDAGPVEALAEADAASLCGVRQCNDQEVCVKTATSAACYRRACKTGEIQCRDDRSGLRACSASQTTFEDGASCAENEVCVGAACKPATTPLGAVAVRKAADGPLTLDPGYYAVAVVDTNTTAASDIAFPVAVDGATSDVPEPPTTKATRSLPANPLRCTTAAVEARLRNARSSRSRAATPATHPIPPPWREPVIGDTRVFHMPDPSPTPSGTGILDRKAKLRHVGTYANFWEDQTDRAGLISDTDLATLSERIDQGVVARDQAIFGPLTDVDGNGKADILFTNLLPNGNAAAFVTPATSLRPPAYTKARYGVDLDYGEVIYSMAPSGDVSWLAYAMAHELQHLIYFGRRLQPYLNDGTDEPAWVHADTYAVEGIAELAGAWSGQYYPDAQVLALQSSSVLSLSRLVGNAYIEDPQENAAAYGMGGLVMEYLFDQAGAAGISGPHTVTDKGGIAFVDAFTTAQQGVSRLVTQDGRALADWYPEFAAAVLLSTFAPEQLYASTLAEKKLWFIPGSEDSTFHGWLGGCFDSGCLPQGYRSGNLVRTLSWGERPKTMKVGGFVLLRVAVGDAGATLTVNGPSARVAVVRFKSAPVKTP